MLDKFNRNINYLRISLTSECNLRCLYCYTKPVKTNINKNNILSKEQIQAIVTEAAIIGINKIRLTGGEPLLRDDICEIVRLTSSLEAIHTVGITTNGSFLQKKIDGLVGAGLNSLNISLDTINPYKYSYITRGGNFFDVIRGIEKTLSYNIPIKINMVVVDNVNRDEIESMKNFCDYYGIKLQLIKHFSLDQSKTEDEDYDRPPKCIFCNKIRLLSDGKLKPCLHSTQEFAIDYKDIQSSLIRTVLAKPKNGQSFCNKNMVEIGG